MTSPEFEKVNEPRSFRGSKKPKFRFGCKMYCESRGGTRLRKTAKIHGVLYYGKRS